MKIKLLMHKQFNEPEIHICFKELTEEVNHLKETIEQAVNFTIMGYTQNGVEVIAADTIVRIYTEGQSVYAASEEKVFKLHQRLYELEEMLQGKNFIRISNSEIVNVKKIIRLDTSVTGTICILLKGGLESYVSRRNVSRIKKVLGI